MYMIFLRGSGKRLDRCRHFVGLVITVERLIGQVGELDDIPAGERLRQVQRILDNISSGQHVSIIVQRKALHHMCLVAVRHKPVKSHGRDDPG